MPLPKSRPNSPICGDPGSSHERVLRNESLRWTLKAKPAPQGDPKPNAIFLVFHMGWGGGSLAQNLLTGSSFSWASWKSDAALWVLRWRRQVSLQSRVCRGPAKGRGQPCPRPLHTPPFASPRENEGVFVRRRHASLIFPMKYFRCLGNKGSVTIGLSCCQN